MTRSLRLLWLVAAAQACSGSTDSGSTPVIGAEVVSSDLGGAVDAQPGDGEGTDLGLPPVTTDVAEITAEPIPFQPCAENADCPSGYCVESKDGRTCTRECVSDCPDGWRCTNVSGTGTDIVFLCVPKFVTLCMPCGNDSDCAGDGGLADGKCLDYGAEGQFCGAACSPDTADCPSGYLCDGGQCRLETGLCECTWKAIKEAATTACSATNELGTCLGSRGCLDGTLSICDARTPMGESCNAVDDDCDGQTDEGIAQDACSNTTDAGTCTGVTTCAAGVSTCTAAVPVPEVCDGKDNDCDTLADEGFADTNADGVADCISDDDDGDGVPDTTDNCPSASNAGQEDMDKDGVGDACDPDRDGDNDPNGSDCAPDDATIGKGATESCNGKDDDCDTLIDEGFSDLDKDTVADCQDDDDDGDAVLDTVDNCPFTPNAAQSDSDGDGKGNACEDDIDGDSDPDLTDCAPQDATVHHGASEQCDGADQNCNGIVDEGFPDTDQDGVMDCLDTDDDGDLVADMDDLCPLKPDPEQLDTDGDGKGDACDTDDDGDGTPDVIDCGPMDATVSPKALETCNGKDDDCDALVDEIGADGCSPFLFDNDGDGFGVGTATQCLCGPKAPFTATASGDCNDQNGLVFPAATETCNQVDDDCDDLKDEGAAVGCVDAYADQDKDGYGAGTAACTCPGTPGFSTFGGDCADLDASVKPGALEACNGKDDGCNGLIDEPGAFGCKTYYADADGDGAGAAALQQCLCAPDVAQGYTATVAGDCNDNDGAAAPGKPEICNGKDDDCDGQTDEADAGGCVTYLYDNDGDGFGGGATSACLCGPKAPFTATASGDCNDQNALVFPDATESCNQVDDDCDGLKDEGAAAGCIDLFVDADKDGVGTGTSSCICPGATGTAAVGGDCNDADAGVRPGAIETCNGKDDNCSGQVDEQGASGCQSFFKDVDGDGIGQSGEIRCLCAADPVSKFTSSVAGDCNDADVDIAPAHAETCDLKDNNCNGQIDEGVQTTYFLDEDGDGFGASYSSKLACTPPPGFVAKAGDCNDFNKNIRPLAKELCNDIDDDCNGVTDDGVATLTMYKDNDGDGVATKNAAKLDKCNVPIGWALPVDKTGDGVNDWDCDDSDSTVLPGGATVCGDGKDNDCDGVVDRMCFAQCAGEWPYKPAYTTDAPSAQIADLHGDGSAEILVSHSFGFGILRSDGHPLYDYSAANYNYARAAPVLADIDDTDTFGAGIQSLEVLTGNGSHPKYYKVSPAGVVTVIDSAADLYDASRFMARDLDYDGKSEFISSTWCEANGTKIFRFTPPSTITLVKEIASPNGTCQYYDGRALTDLNGDGTPELLWGDGYPVANAPSYWGGRLFAQAFTNPTTLTTADFCSGAACFPVDVAGLFPGGVNDLVRLPTEIRVYSTYFQTNTPSVPNAGTVQTTRYNLDGTRIATAAGNSLWNGLSDVDDDGVAENYGADVTSLGLYDVNGDGLPDRITSSGKSLRVQRWDPATKAFVTNAGSDLPISAQNVAVRAISDLDGDGRINIISSDPSGVVYCHELGPSTWNQAANLPPTSTAAYRTYQWDNYEPNDGKDTNTDGVPDQVVRIPSALTATGQFYSYLSTATDEDFYMVDTQWGGSICLRSPKGRSYGLRVYSQFDLWNNATKAPGADGKPDGLIWEDNGTAGNKCFSGSLINPYRYGLYKFVVGIKSTNGAYSMHWPYYLQAQK